MGKGGYILLLVILLMFHQNANAGMYKCIDSSGSITFTDTLESEYCSPVVFKERKTSFRKWDGTNNYSQISRRAAAYEQFISYYGVRYNIDPHLIRAVIRTESAFDPNAISKRGAQGLMQLMPDTAKELSVSDPFDPEENIEGGTKYLRSLLNTFKNDLRLALAAYNAGPTIVKKQNSIPRIPETIQYVDRVLKYYQEYKNG